MAGSSAGFFGSTNDTGSAARFYYPRGVPGALTYTPASGAVLTAGAQTLSVGFTAGRR